MRGFLPHLAPRGSGGSGEPSGGLGGGGPGPPVWHMVGEGEGPASGASPEAVSVVVAVAPSSTEDSTLNPSSGGAGGWGLRGVSSPRGLRAGRRGPGREAPGSPAQARRRSGRSTGGGRVGGGGGNPPPIRNCLQSRCRCWETHLRGWRGGEASGALEALTGPCPPRGGPGRSARWLASPLICSLFP